MHNNHAKFTIPDIRSFVPEKLKPWIMIALVIIYQLSGGIYLSSANEMAGSLALMHEDIMMAGYSMLLGVALCIVIMFRLKFRFSTKNSLRITAVGLIICNLICMYTACVPILVIACFASGLFKLWGTLACNTTINLWITPTRDLSVWFTFIFLVIISMIPITGITTSFVSWFGGSWECMHWFMICLLLCVLLLTFVIFRHFRFMDRVPLLGIDFTGMALWTSSALSAIFILNYGDYYDWFQSGWIWAGICICLVTLVLNLWRATWVSHPFIEFETWRRPVVWLTILMYGAVTLLLSPSNLLEHIYLKSLLGYDSLNSASLNWVVFAGTIAGSIFCYRYLALKKWTFKTMTLIGFSQIVAYLFLFYFIIDRSIPKEILVWPLFTRGFAFVVIVTVFLTSLARIPFEKRFQAVAVAMVISTCIGPLFGNALLTCFFKAVMQKNMILLGANLDNVNRVVQNIPGVELFNRLRAQAMIVSIKELYGIMSIAGIFILMILFLKTSIVVEITNIRRCLMNAFKTGKS